MIARAPGKLVLSGAYVVLDGAPAVVATVDRYAEADAARAPEFVGAELAAAFPSGRVPFVDVSSMRAGGRKLGLGSSAAGLVAAIAADRWRALEGAPLDADDDERRAIAAIAYAAHRSAQGGGSGIDVVASAIGGILVCEAREGAPPAHRVLDLPAGLVIEAWVCPESGSTAALLRPVRALAAGDPSRYASLVAPARRGAAAFVDACARNDEVGALAAAGDQLRGMRALGAAAGVPIVPPYLAALADLAASEGAVFAQAGAGGGDVALYFGRAESSPGLCRDAVSRGLARVPLALGARGVHAAPSNLLSTSSPFAST